MGACGKGQSHTRHETLQEYEAHKYRELTGKPVSPKKHETLQEYEARRSEELKGKNDSDVPWP